MVEVVIKGKIYTVDDTIRVIGVTDLNNSFLAKEDNFYYGYVSEKETIYTVKGTNLIKSSSLMLLEHKGFEFAILVDDIRKYIQNIGADNSQHLSEYIEHNIFKM